MNQAVIVAGVRTAVGKAPRGALRTTRPDDMAAAVITDLLKRTPDLPPDSIDDVILGCAMPEAESGANHRGQTDDSRFATLDERVTMLARVAAGLTGTA